MFNIVVNGEVVGQGNNLFISDTTLKDNANITSVDLINANFINVETLETNVMTKSFQNCYNLENVSNIPANITDMNSAFRYCNNLIDIPELPNSVINMFASFDGTKKLNISPTIPDSVTDMNRMFQNSGITGVTHISNSATDLTRSFYRCYNLSGDVDMTYSHAVNMKEAFQECNHITSVTNIPNTVIDLNSAFRSTTIASCPNIGNSVTNMYWTFRSCRQLGGQINIYSEGITNATNCFYDGRTAKQVYIPFYYENGEHTMTYNSFIAAGYSNTTYFHNAILIDLADLNPDLVDWIYSKQPSGDYLLLSYKGNDYDIIVPDSNTIISSTLVNASNDKIVILDMNDIPVQDNSVSMLAYNMQNIQSVTNINDDVTDMVRSFYGCSNLISVDKIPSSTINMFKAFDGCSNLIDAPDMSNATNVVDMNLAFSNCHRLINGPDLSNCTNLTDMSATFYECHNLVNMPTIPNSVTRLNSLFFHCYNLKNTPREIPYGVTDIGGTFLGCNNLVNAPIIPNSVVDMTQTFSYCYNLVNAPEIPNSVVDMYYTFSDCNHLTGDINITSPYVNSAYGCFRCYNNDSLEKNVYIPYYTDTYDAFRKAGYDKFGSQDNVYLKEGVKYYVNNENWAYMEDTTEIVKYLGSEINVVVPNEIDGNIVNTIKSTTFEENGFIKNVDLNDIPFKNNSMYRAFAWCDNLTNVTNINENVINMSNAFYWCNNLVNAPEIPNSVVNMFYAFAYCHNLVNAPEIPNSVIYMYRTFEGCTNLVNATAIPNSVTNMSQTFWNCISLVNAPDMSNATNVTNMYWAFGDCTNLVNVPAIPNSVTNMWGTFYGCTNLVNAPVIPNSVTNMAWTFQFCINLVNVPAIPNNVTNMLSTFYDCSSLVNAPDMSNATNVTNICGTFDSCYNLTGDINIHSENITNAQNCFTNTTLEKNVYIPFQNNGVNTATYNTFTSLGYSDSIRAEDGVLLFDLNNNYTPPDQGSINGDYDDPIGDDFSSTPGEAM